MGIIVHGTFIKGHTAPDWLPSQWTVEVDDNGFTIALDTGGRRYYLTDLKLAIPDQGGGRCDGHNAVSF